MRFRYREWNGEEFATQDHLKLFDQLMEFVLAYGDEAMEAIEQMEMDDEQRELLEKLIQDGLLEKVGARWRLTPRAVNAMQRKALMEVFTRLRKGHKDGHDAPEPGQGGERIEGTRPYQFGDPVSELALAPTLSNTLKRCGPGLPLKISQDDFELHQSEHHTSCSTVILLDMSGSMQRYHRFYHAKKCAMAMHALIRQRFPQDTVDLVGFYSAACVIPEHKLPLLAPKPVSIYDYRVHMRVPIHQADEAPQHFTNLQMGLQLARRLLARRGGENKQMFIITDGQPTAHLQGEYIHLLYPPDRTTTMATLKEALHITRQGIRICTFALAEDYAYMDWIGFVDQLTRLTRGVAFYCAGGELSNCIMESYLSGRKRKTYIA
jgi:Ca-activated chloride channel homolog